MYINNSTFFCHFCLKKNSTQKTCLFLKEEEIIAYGSKTLSRFQMRYCTIYGEPLAVVTYIRDPFYCKQNILI